MTEILAHAIGHALGAVLFASAATTATLAVEALALKPQIHHTIDRIAVPSCGSDQGEPRPATSRPEGPFGLRPELMLLLFERDLIR